MVNAYTRGAVEVLYAGAVEVRSWFGRGTLEVRSRYARGAVEVPSWCGRGTLEVRSSGRGTLLVRSYIVRSRYARGALPVRFRFSTFS